MAKNVIPDPPSAWNPEDIPGWRREQFNDLGFRGDLLEFLANSRIDIHAVAKLTRAGCDPTLAVRIEAGIDHAGEDVQFDHAAFDHLLLGDVEVGDAPDDWFEHQAEDEPPRKTVSGIL
jgi:hypothetical protein